MSSRRSGGASSTAVERKSREAAKKSYKEDSDSAPEPEPESGSDAEVGKVLDPKDKDFSDADLSPSESEEEGSDWGGESSGSEYGKKKKTPKKGAIVARGRGRGRKAAAASPKRATRGRGRPSAAAKNGKKAPVKRGRKADSEDESESEAESSGSEYGKKKKPTPKKATPQKKAKLTPRKRGPPARKAKVVKDDEDEEEEEEKPQRSRRGRAAASKSYKEESDDDVIDPEPEEVAKKPVKKKAKLEEKKKVEESEGSASDKEEPEEEEEEEDKDKEEVKKKDSSKNKKEKEASANGENGEKKETSAEGNGATAGNGHGDDDDRMDVDDEDNDEHVDNDEDGSADADGDKAGKKGLMNPIDTDYSAMELGTDKKSNKGEGWDKKISMWNIGGIKAWLKKNGLEYLKREDPFVMCLNEVKCNEKTKPEEIKELEKYPHQYWSYNAENSGHSGVAMLCQEEPKDVQLGFPVDDDDEASDKKAKKGFNSEGRMITAEFDEFYVVCVYVPNGGPSEKTDKHPKGYPVKVANGEKQKFDELFREHIKTLEKKKPVIVAGDMNVAHQEIDIANPKTNERNAGFTKEEREDFTKLLEETTLIDTFRELYPDKKDTYTFWSYRSNARAKNVGWRLDYLLVSEKLKDSLVDSVMRSRVFGSDHCPIVLFLSTK